MAATIENLDGLIFKKGFLYATRDGGATDAVAFAALQNISLNHAFEFTELRGPEKLSPLGVGVTGESLTGSAEFAVMTPEQFVAIMGGSQADDGTNTTYTKKNTEEPRTFDLRLKAPLDGSDLEVVVYRCLCTNYRILDGSANREFNLTAFDFRAYGQTDANGAKLFTVKRPGVLTGAS